MPQPFRVEITSKRTGETQVQSGTFSTADWDLLLRFLDYAEEVLAWASAGSTRVNYGQRWTPESGLEHRWEVPTADRVGSLLHRLRPFVLNDEETNFLRTCNVLCRNVTLPNFRTAIDMLRRRFLDKDFRSQVVMSANGTILNSEDVLRLWLNGFEYHRDRAKQDELKALACIVPLEAQRAIFLSMMLDKAKAVIDLARIVQ